MTYTEWRDELKNNLLCVSDSERRRVLDYYAEAYADRREAGFSEHEIIEQFGAPYDAAQRILTDRSEYSGEFFRDDKPICEYSGRREPSDEDRRKRKEKYRDTTNDDDYRYPQDDGFNVQKGRRTKDEERTNRLLFILLCIIFAAPLFGLLMGMVGITIGFCVAPFAVLISGVGGIINGIGTMVSGELFAGLGIVGIGVIILGVGIILTAVFLKLVKLIWKLWNSFFRWLKSLFGIGKKEKA